MSYIYQYMQIHVSLIPRPYSQMFTDGAVTYYYPRNSMHCIMPRIILIQYAKSYAYTEFLSMLITQCTYLCIFVCTCNGTVFHAIGWCHLM